MSNDDKHELQFKLLDYHHRAMESRRAIQLQIFLGTVAVYWLLIHNASDLISKMKNSILMQMSFVIMWFLYLVFTIQVEGWNKQDRQKYLSLEKSLWASSVGGNKSEEEKECWRRTLWRSWAGVLSVVMISFLTYASWLFLSSLKPGN